MFPQKRRTRLVAFAAAGSLLALTAACSGGGGSDDEANDDGTPSGEITVLTWRTDLVEDGTFDTYVEEFKAKYPEVTDVKVEGVTDYEGTVKTRMNTDDYGDVLAIPGSVTPDQLPDFFEPLGDQAEMEKEYRWINDKSFEGKSYGIPVVGNVQGILYNKRVWEEAGITDFPTTPQEFLDDLQAIKDNGRHGRPALHQLQGLLGALAVGRLARGRHGEPGLRQRDDGDGHPVDRRVRLGRHRRHDLRRRRAGPHRGRPDHDRLGGLQAHDRRRRDRARWCSARGRSRRWPRPRRPPAPTRRDIALHADPVAGRRQVPHGGRR